MDGECGSANEGDDADGETTHPTGEVKTAVATASKPRALRRRPAAAPAQSTPPPKDKVGEGKATPSPEQDAAMSEEKGDKHEKKPIPESEKKGLVVDKSLIIDQREPAAKRTKLTSADAVTSGNVGNTASQQLQKTKSTDALTRETVTPPSMGLASELEGMSDSDSEGDGVTS